MSDSSVFVTTFLAAAVEVIEMVIIVVGVGSVRGWRPTWLGAGGGLAAVVLAFKGVLLEGLEVAFIVVSFGLAPGRLAAPWRVGPQRPW